MEFRDLASAAASCSMLRTLCTLKVELGQQLSAALVRRKAVELGLPHQRGEWTTSSSDRPSRIVDVLCCCCLYHHTEEGEGGAESD